MLIPFFPQPVSSRNNLNNNGGAGGDNSDGSTGPTISFLDDVTLFPGAYFSGGGGSGTKLGAGTGGGNGGVLINNVPQNGSNGLPNTGGGGGGGTSYTGTATTKRSSSGGNGGSGVVLLYFKNPSQIAITSRYIEFPDGSQQIAAYKQPTIIESNLSNGMFETGNLVYIFSGILPYDSLGGIYLTAGTYMVWLGINTEVNTVDITDFRIGIAKNTTLVNSSTAIQCADACVNYTCYFQKTDDAVGSATGDVENRVVSGCFTLVTGKKVYPFVRFTVTGANPISSINCIFVKISG